MKLKYGLEKKPPKMEMFLYGIQWFAITLPMILVIGNIMSHIHGINTITYMQSLFIMIGFALLLQISFGHKLPVIIGPATILLIPALATMNHGFGSINSSLVIGGCVLAIIALSGTLKYIQKLFTSRVIIVVLLLIVFTLIPTILNLIIVNNGVLSSANFMFVLISLFIVLLAHKFFKGLWNSAISLWIILLGSIFYYLIFNPTTMGIFNVSIIAVPNIQVNLSIPDLGIVLVFLACFLALTIKDIGSIQSIISIIKPLPPPPLILKIGSKMGLE